jgi:hypothetical protein
MVADLQLVTDTWNALHSFVREEKCAACECLQGALMELRLCLEELPADPEQGRLLAEIGKAMQVGPPHECLGCQPCNPGDILAIYYREQQAREAPPQIACCDT